MVAKKKKKRPTRALEAELEDTDTVDSEVAEEEESDEKLDMQNLKISVKTVEQLLDLAYEGQEVFTTIEFIRQDTSEIVAVATSDDKSVTYRIDPSEWAYEIAAGLYENLEGEGQDPERVNPIEDGYEFIAY
ncbi:MAG: hypothetical protein EBR94_00855 [Bacteroidetes bacterium]|nr:hypothetical protein [Bacteroidota bacterium]